jgi:hypothetical protein
VAAAGRRACQRRAANMGLMAETYEGAIHRDTEALSRLFRNGGMPVEMHVVHQGHSFGAWREGVVECSGTSLVAAVDLASTYPVVESRGCRVLTGQRSSKAEPMSARQKNAGPIARAVAEPPEAHILRKTPPIYRRPGRPSGPSPSSSRRPSASTR